MKTTRPSATPPLFIPLVGKRLDGARHDTGFALVVTLTLVILLIILAVGLLGLSSLSLRSSSHATAQATAKANARLAMMLAIGDLQKHLGPDQRISINADQRSDTGSDGSKSLAHENRRHWTGVFDSWPSTFDLRPEPSFRTWLVSGNPAESSRITLAESQPASSNDIELVGSGTLGTSESGKVKVPSTALLSNGSPDGRLAWWIGDQGTKAALATTPHSNQTTLGFIRGNLQSAPRNATELATAENHLPFAEVKPDDPRLANLTGWRQAELLTPDPASPRPLFHDLTAFSSGLLTNVRSGGFRKDLSMKLESYTGPPKLTEPSDSLYQINGEPGINFKEIWAYYHLYKQLQTRGGGTYTTGGSIPAGTPHLRIATGVSAVSRDYWHYFKQPVIISYQLVLSFSMRPAPAPNAGQMCLHVDFDPIITLWNPLDVPVVIPQESWLHVGYWLVPYDVNVVINGTISKRCSLTRSVNGTGNSMDYHFLGLNAGKVEPLVFKPGEVIKISQTGDTASGPARTNGLDGRKGFNYGGGTAVPLRDESGALILLNPADQITYTATANNLTCGKDSSGGNIIAGLGTNNSRRWSLTQNSVYIGAPYGLHAGLGIISVDWCLGRKRPSRDDESNSTERTKSDPLNNKTAANSTRLYADQFPHVFKPITGPDNTRQISAASINNRKSTFMLVSYDAKTEEGSDRGNRYLAHFNPKAFHVDFYNLSEQERDIIPYEISAIPLTSWLNAPLDESTNGNGFFGSSLRSELGSSFVTTHSVPREPILSLAALQHSFANGFNFLSPPAGVDMCNNREPILPQVSHAIGNSTATSVLPPDKTEGNLIGNPNPIADHSYLANRALWDDYFFSGIAPQFLPNFPRTRDQKTVLSEFLTDTSPLRNARYLPDLDGQDPTRFANSLFSGRTPNTRAINNIASYLRVDGLFNVNSTSVEAWKALLGSLKEMPVVVRNENGAESIAPADDNSPVANLAAPADVISKDDDALKSDAQWVGRRTLTDDEISGLAQVIVREIRKRGPFLSLADFINRRVGSDRDLARAGAIQSALDSDEVEINRKHNTARAVDSATAARFLFPEAEQGPRAYGSPAVVKQADILTPIAPVLSVRSDSFLIRTHGQATDSTGKVIARAWCEAVVERDRNFVDPSDLAESPVNTLSSINQTFGRRFVITSFRWLTPGEI